MDWKKYIITEPDTLKGKPHVAGTRLSVEFILELFASGWTRESILANYPTLDDDRLKAVFAFTAEAMHDEALFYLKKKLHEVSC
jgi:uncharacterized protein (DUF433 family)